MRALIVSLVAIFFFGACSTMQVRSPAVSILVDLDPASVDRTVIVESITANKEGRLSAGSSHRERSTGRSQVSQARRGRPN